MQTTAYLAHVCSAQGQVAAPRHPTPCPTPSSASSTQPPMALFGRFLAPAAASPLFNLMCKQNIAPLSRPPLLSFPRPFSSPLHLPSQGRGHRATGRAMRRGHGAGHGASNRTGRLADYQHAKCEQGWVNLLPRKKKSDPEFNPKFCRVKNSKHEKLVKQYHFLN